MKNKNKKRDHRPVSYSDSDSGTLLYELIDFPSTESSSRHMTCHPTWESSSTSAFETEDQEFDDLSNYIPQWPVTGRRGRRSSMSMREKQDVEGKKMVLESKPIGNMGGYPGKKLTTGERGCNDGTTSTSVKVNNLSEKGKGKPVVESDDFGNISGDGFGTKNCNSIIPSEEPPVNNKSHKNKTSTKKHNYVLKKNRSTSSRKGFPTSRDLTDHTRFPRNDTKEDFLSPARSSSTRPKVLPFDLNDLPPTEDEDDAIEH